MRQITLGSTGIIAVQNAFGALPVQRVNMDTAVMILRRAPSANWLSEDMQAEMSKIENCLNCGLCKTKCPFELNTPELLRKNLEDYKRVLVGEVKV